jgi:PST family polysaccharide transporter
MLNSAEVRSKETIVDKAQPTLKQKTLSGLKWSTVAQIGKQIGQFVIVAILARLLSPDDFGLLGMITVFTGFAMIFGELGVGAAIIQKQDVTDELLSSAFWVNVASGVLLSLLFVGLAPVIAWFYNKPELYLLVTVISLNFILISFTTIQQTILQKKMDFKPLMVRDIASVVGGGVVGIVCAFNGIGVWSLVFQTLSTTVINGVLLWIYSSWRPKFVFSWLHIKSIIGFSANVTGFQTVNYFARNVDYLLVGKFLGAEALGFYTLAYKLMLTPLQNISGVISRVMFPAFSEIQHDHSKVRHNYQKVIRAISTITFPLMLGLFLMADEVVYLVYGPQWEPSILAVKILCFCGLLQSINTTVGIIYNSQGRADIPFKFSLFLTGPSVVIAVLLGLNYGFVGVALFYTIRSYILAIPSHYLANRIIKLSWREFLSPLVEVVAKSLVVFGVVLGAEMLIKLYFDLDLVQTLAFKFFLYSLTYAIVFGWGLTPSMWRVKLASLK